MRYETGVAIGRGASAEVFKAWDPATERAVALKIFPQSFRDDGAGDDGARREREARVQASLDHPSICEIYEVGVTPGGRHFIAMQLVEGEPLDEVCARLPIRQRVELVLQVAEAVAVAHKAGLVHRDLKPSNLLVETRDGGARRAFVLDFGIVHLSDASRLTSTGQILGTPGYLSPEQARGERETTARSDVFALGVVLFQVLTGRMPFAAASDIGSLVRVLDHEPPPAHVLAPEVSPALSHIAQKAMEKEPRRRYADAQALARDLERALRDGVARARGIGLLGRALRRAERHPRLTVVGLALVVLALVAAAWGVRERLRGESQARDAEVFARRAIEIEARSRFARLLPRHPVHAERDRLLTELALLEADITDARGRALAAGAYAVGRAARALEQHDKAIASLARARDAGFDDPVWLVDWSLAQLEETREHLREAELLRDPETRSAFRDRALEALRAVLPPPSDAEEALEQDDGLMIRALRAFLDGEHETARLAAQTLIDRAPWRVEADLLLADLEREAASLAFLGEDPARTGNALEAERNVLEGALVRAPSEPRLYRRLAENRMTAARAAHGVGDDRWLVRFEEADGALEAALTVLPDDLKTRNLGVEIGWRRTLARLRAEGAEGLLDAARGNVASARMLVDDPQAGASVHRNLGNALYAEAEVLRELGEPQPALFEASARALERSLELAPGSALGWQSLGIAWVRHGTATDASGGDPRAAYRRAVAAFERSLGGVRVHESRALSSICVAWSELAYYGLTHRDVVDEGEIEQALAEAEVTCERSVSIAPTYLPAHSNRATMGWTQVQWRIATGHDPAEAYARARAYFAGLLNLAPQHTSGRINAAGLAVTMARWRLDQAAPVDASTMAAWADDITAARNQVAPLLERFPVDVGIQLARLDTSLAAVRCRQGTPAAVAFVDARVSVARLDGASSYVSLRALIRATYERRFATCLLDSAGGDEAQVVRALDAAREAIEKALRADSTLAEALAERARLDAVTARVSQP